MTDHSNEASGGFPDLSADDGQLLVDEGSGRTPQHAEAEAFLHALDKSLRMFSFYEGRGANFENSVNVAFERLSALLESHGDLRLEISPFEFLLGTIPVYASEEEKQGITYKLFRDGLRELTLAQGLERKEFMVLMDIMRGTQPGESENNTVTLLWDANPPHIRFRAISAFQEGTEDSDRGGAEVNISRVMQELHQPLFGAPDGLPMAALDPTIMRKAMAARDKVLGQLPTEDALPEFLAGLQRKLEGLSDDLWQRAIHIGSRMVQLGVGAKEVSAVLSQILEEKLISGSWEDLSTTCGNMAETMAQARGPEGVKGLEPILSSLASGGKLRRILPRLNEASLEDFDHLLPFLKMLPREVNPDLKALLLSMKPSEVQERLHKLLEERGVDLTDLHAKNLKSTNQDQVLEAIKTLSELGTQQALASLPPVLGHPSARVRLEALKVLTGRFEPKSFPQPALEHLISSLGSGYQELQDLAFDILLNVPRCNFGRDLLDMMQLPEKVKTWDAKRMNQAYRLLVRWGGHGVDDFIINSITVKGLFVRKKQEDLRDELINALTEVGGDRARSILAACKGRKVSSAIRQRLDDAAAKVR